MGNGLNLLLNNYWNENLATGEVVGYAQNSTVQDVEQAIDSVFHVFNQSDWGYNPKRRYNALLGLAQKMEENIEHLASVLTMEQGKTIIESRGEIAGCIDTLKYFAGAAELRDLAVQSSLSPKISVLLPKSRLV